MHLVVLRPVFLLFFTTPLLIGCEQPAPPKMSPPPPVVTLKVITKNVPLAPEFVGKTVSSRKVEIRSRVEGFLEKRLYTEGEPVVSGQALFQMDAKPFQVQLDAVNAELAQQQARVDTAAADLKRVRPLVAKKAVAQKELDDANGTYLSAAAAVEIAKANVAQAKLNLGYTTIYSPVSGVSSFAVQQEGAFIGMGSGSLLTYVAQVDPIWVEFSVSENQILEYRQQLKTGLLTSAGKGNYGVDIVLADGSLYPHTGKIIFADVSLSDKTGTFLMRGTLPNPEGQLRPGQFVRALIKGTTRTNAIVIPKRAVQQGPAGSNVWVINDQNKAELRPVTPGPWIGDQWFIDKGLSNGDQIVVDGASKLRPGVTVSRVSADTK